MKHLKKFNEMKTPVFVDVDLDTIGQSADIDADESNIINEIPNIIDSTNHCHSIGLIKTDGSVEVYSNHMEGFELTRCFESELEFKKVFGEYINGFEVLDEYFINELKSRIKNIQKILYWGF